MGQRVQVLVIKENNKGERKSTFFHHQWGIGRIMYFGLIDLFMQDYSKDTFRKGYDYLSPARFGTNEKYYDITGDVPRKVLDNIDPDNFATIAHIFDWGDNNNGGMVVYMKEDKECDYNRSDIKIGFLLGDEDTHHIYEDGDERNPDNDDEAFARWLTPEEYGKMNCGSEYSDEEFVKIFTDFCQYFDITFFENTTTMKENIVALKKRRNDFEDYREQFIGKEVPCGYDE